MTTEHLKELFIDAFNKENLAFNEIDTSHDSLVVLTAKGDNLEEINVYISFAINSDGSILSNIGCYDFPNFIGCEEAGYRACNQLNNDEWVKYYIDKDGDAVAYAVVLFNGYEINNEFSPEQILSVATIMKLSADYAYPVLKEAKQGE